MIHRIITKNLTVESDPFIGIVPRVRDEDVAFNSGKSTVYVDPKISVILGGLSYSIHHILRHPYSISTDTFLRDKLVSVVQSLRAIDKNQESIIKIEYTNSVDTIFTYTVHLMTAEELDVGVSFPQRKENLIIVNESLKAEGHTAFVCNYNLLEDSTIYVDDEIICPISQSIFGNSIISKYSQFYREFQKAFNELLDSYCFFTYEHVEKHNRINSILDTLIYRYGNYLNCSENDPRKFIISTWNEIIPKLDVGIDGFTGGGMPYMKSKANPGSIYHIPLDSMGTGARALLEIVPVLKLRPEMLVIDPVVFRFPELHTLLRQHILSLFEERCTTAVFPELI